MKDSRVEKFNVIVGKAPSSDVKEVFKQIQDQCQYLLEEVDETLEAAQQGNIIEVVDGACDVKYVASQLQTLIESLGVMFAESFSAVCANNDEKYTTSVELAMSWQAEQAKGGVPCTISEVVYEGVTYYTVKHADTRKVLKYKNFPTVSLKEFIPKELLNE